MNKRNRGFTLLELMVVLVIAALLLGIGIPAMGNFIRNARITASANDLLAAMHLARSESIKRKSATTVCASSNPLDAAADCLTAGTGSRLLDGNNGWIVFVDADADATRDAGEEVIQQHAPLPAGVVARSSVTPFRLTYVDTGFSGTFVDLDGDGRRDLETEVDINGDGIVDPDEDLDGNGTLDMAEPWVRGSAFNVVFCDRRGNVDSGGGLSAARGLTIAATGRAGITRDPGEITALLADNPGGAIEGCN